LKNPLPASQTVAAAAATTYTLTPTGPAYAGAATTVTVTPDAAYTGTITLTPSGCGLTAPVVLTFAGAPPQTATFTPAAAGVLTLTPSNSGGLANPPAPVLTIVGPGHMHHVSEYSLTATGVVEVAAPASGRVVAYFQNQGVADVWLGGPDVAVSRGLKLPGGLTPPAEFTDTSSGAAWYAAASGATTLAVDAVY
jgi:hypothetical protein